MSGGGSCAYDDTYDNISEREIIRNFFILHQRLKLTLQVTKIMRELQYRSGVVEGRGVEFGAEGDILWGRVTN